MLSNNKLYQQILILIIILVYLLRQFHLIEMKYLTKYFKGKVEDNGSSFTITPSPFFMDLLKAINKGDQ